MQYDDTTGECHVGSFEDDESYDESSEEIIKVYKSQIQKPGMSLAFLQKFGTNISD